MTEAEVKKAIEASGLSIYSQNYELNVDAVIFAVQMPGFAGFASVAFSGVELLQAVNPEGIVQTRIASAKSKLETEGVQ